MFADEPSEWQQHFPTYRFKNRDVVLEEYRTAARSLEAEERVYLNAANVNLVVGAGLVAVGATTFDKLIGYFGDVVAEEYLIVAVLIPLLIVTTTTLRYFADRNKSIILAARKVIVLRRMLGLTYGNLRLVLPNWRVEGASEPFAVRMFPGWWSQATYPFFVTVAFTTLAFGLLLLRVLHLVSADLLLSDGVLFAIGLTIWLGIMFFVYRRALFDTHEDYWLVCARNVARVLGVRLVGNIEYVMYRATLARYELGRLRLNLKSLKEMIVFVEDREFYGHSGVHWRSVVRAAMSIMGFKRDTGGSTLSQQLARTLVVVDLHKRWRRKLVEVWTSPGSLDTPEAIL